MSRPEFKTTIEVWSTTRDDIALLAAHEAKALDLPRLSNADYLKRLAAREKKAKKLV